MHCAEASKKSDDGSTTDDDMPTDFGEDDCMLLEKSSDENSQEIAAKLTAKAEQTVHETSDDKSHTKLLRNVVKAKRNEKGRPKDRSSLDEVDDNFEKTPSTETGRGSSSAVAVATVAPSLSQYRELKACINCGKLGIPDSFYSCRERSSKRFCSMTCARSYARKVFPRYAVDDISLQPERNSTSASSLTEVAIGSSSRNANVTKAANMSVSATTTARTSPTTTTTTTTGLSAARTGRPFDWKEYLIQENAVAAPVSCFKHCPMSESWSKSLLVGAKIEMLNTNTEITEYPVYWIATVIDLAGYGARVRYEGYEDNGSKDFWIHLCSKDVHNIGWCAANNKPLVPPKLLQYRIADWKEYLLRKLIGASTLPVDFHRRIKLNISRWPFRVGMKLEVVDRSCLATMTVATVEEVVGGRIRLRYTLSDVADDFFWCHSLSKLIHPIGWAHSIGHRIRVSTESKSKSTGDAAKPQKNNATPSMFPKPKGEQQTPFEVGMKLEAIDPLNLGTICVATVREVLRDGYIMIGIDTSISAALAIGSTPTAKRYDMFCHHWTSPYIFPPGFCERNYLRLSMPKGCNQPFRWSEYLELTNSNPAPRSCFDRDVPKHAFRIGMKLEAVDLIEPRLICVATVVNVIGRLLKIQFDGWDSMYDQWMDFLSADIYPLGWCDMVGHRLEGPHAAATVTQLEKKRLPKTRIFKGGRKKRKHKMLHSTVSTPATSRPQSTAQSPASRSTSQPASTAQSPAVSHRSGAPGTTPSPVGSQTSQARSPTVNQPSRPVVSPSGTEASNKDDNSPAAKKQKLRDIRVDVSAIIGPLEMPKLTVSPDTVNVAQSATADDMPRIDPRPS